MRLHNDIGEKVMNQAIIRRL